jgi:hypothetical protein
MMEKMNEYVGSKLSNPSAKLEVSVLYGYVAALLHSITSGCSIDPPSL